MRWIVCVAVVLLAVAASAASAAPSASPSGSTAAQDRDCGTIQFPATVTRNGVTRRTLWSAVVDIPKGSIKCPAARTVIRAYAQHGVVRPAWTCYGDLFTLRTLLFGAQVFTSDPELIKQIFTGDPDTLHAGAPSGTKLLTGETSVLVIDGAPHRRARRLLTPPFHGERMHGYAEAMRTITERVTSSWKPGPTPRPARSEARVDRATRLSQSPRLDSDVAIHSRRKGLIESTLEPAAAMGGDRKLTALGYLSQAPSAAFISVFVLRHGHIFPVPRLDRPALPASHYFCG